jgi:uncharacterized membrane protein YccC
MGDETKRRILEVLPLVCGILAIFLSLIPWLAIITAIAGQVAGFYYSYTYEKKRIVSVGIGICIVYLISILLFGVFMSMFMGIANQLRK